MVALVRRFCSLYSRAVVLLAAAVLLLSSLSPSLAQQIMEAPTTPETAEPSLSGQHFRITVVEQAGYVDIEEEFDGTLSFSGYLIDILNELSREDRGNFTYTLLTPSGFGSGCNPRLEYDMNSTTALEDHPEAFHPRYRAQYKCAEADVNDRPLSLYSTDFYWGVFYITTARLQSNKFTVPFSPPTDGTLAMMGTATYINSMEDLLENHYLTKTICAFAETAYIETLRMSFPRVEFTGLMNSADSVYDALNTGKCDVLIGTKNEVAHLVKRFSEDGKCRANGGMVSTVQEGDPGRCIHLVLFMPCSINTFILILS